MAQQKCCVHRSNKTSLAVLADHSLGGICEQLWLIEARENLSLYFNDFNLYTAEENNMGLSF